MSAPANLRVVRFTPKPRVAKNQTLLQLWRQLDPSFQVALIKIMKIRIAARRAPRHSEYQRCADTMETRVIPVGTDGEGA